MSTTGVAVATAIMIDLLNASVAISQIIRQAQAEGRDNLTPDEWASIDADATKANTRFATAIEAAKGKAAG